MPSREVPVTLATIEGVEELVLSLTSLVSTRKPKGMEECRHNIEFFLKLFGNNIMALVMEQASSTGPRRP